MIKKLEIQNFQSHKNTELTLAPGVNVIVGATDSGKTAIIRALRWLIWNRPSGEAFRSNWGGDTVVDIEADNHHWSRLKGKQNHYHYNGGTFAAFGAGVPEEVSKSLNIDDINLQMQLDSPFLISASAGETASYFNRIAHLDQIDIGLKNIQGWIRKLSMRHDEDADRISDLQETHKHYDYIPKFEARLEVLESIQGEKIHQVSMLQKLSSVLNELVGLEKELVRVQEITSHKTQVLKILSLIKEKEKVQKEWNTLQAHTNQYKDALDMISFYKERAKPLNKVTQILELIDKRDKLQKDGDHLEAKLFALKDITDKWKNKTTLAEAGQRAFEQNMPDVCPLCETDLTNRK